MEFLSDKESEFRKEYKNFRKLTNRFNEADKDDVRAMAKGLLRIIKTTQRSPKTFYYTRMDRYLFNIVTKNMICIYQTCHDDTVILRYGESAQRMITCGISTINHCIKLAEDLTRSNRFASEWAECYN